MILVVLAVIFGSWFWQRDKRPSWLYYLPWLAVALLACHLLLEKGRWQMAPAYVLVGIAVVVNIFYATVKPSSVAQKGPRRRGRVLLKLLGLFLAWLTLVMGVILAVVFPVFRLPEPGGPYAVGMMDFYWVDLARPETFTPDPDDRRALMVHAWYPADPLPGAVPRSIWPEVDQIFPPIMHRIGLPPFVGGHASLVKSHAFQDAPLSLAEPLYPVLVFSHGYSGSAMFYQAQMEELASHGYIIYSIEHTYESLGVVFPDGRVALIDPLAFRTLIGASVLDLDKRLNTWVQDTLFVMDQIESLQAGDLESAFRGRLDLDKLGVFGMSFGGATATEVCLFDARCQAGANMDGSQFGETDFQQFHLERPFLWFYNESSEGMNDFIYRRVENQAYRVTIAGTVHTNFTDIGLWFPLVRYIPMGPVRLLGPIDPSRMVEIENAYLLAFFDRHLKGKITPLLDGPSPYEEVDYQFRVLPY